MLGTMLFCKDPGSRSSERDRPPEGSLSCRHQSDNRPGEIHHITPGAGLERRVGDVHTGVDSCELLTAELVM
jgi:hypothetical protein